MSFVLVSPETVAAVATDLKRIGASLAHENASAAASTTAVVSAAATRYRRRSPLCSPNTPRATKRRPLR
nr:PE domain-containing protein [Mycobacterium tuberculosis]